MRATRVIIHLDRYRRNLRAVQERIGPKRRICLPVKADAYGHGAIQIATAGMEAGAYCLGVATVQEGAQLREGGINAPILLFSQALPDEIPHILENRLEPFVTDSEFVTMLDHAAGAAGIRLPVHLKIDTGMGRMGCVPAQAPDLARCIASCTALEYAGTATHLAVSDSADSGDIAYTRQQLTRFGEALNLIRAAGLNPGIVHAANSGAVIRYPDAWFDMVRPGILLYGYKTVEEADPETTGEGGDLLKPLHIEPVMELRTAVVCIKKVKQGESISYGRTWTAPEDTIIALLPVGYADGLPRLASNRWQAQIGGGIYPLVGRICMDQCMVNVGPDTNIRRWDEVTLFGGHAPDAAALAEQVGTIPYEITCNISKRVPRLYQ